MHPSSGLRIAELLLADGQVEAARRILAQAYSTIPAERSSASCEIHFLRAEVDKAEDARLLAEFNAWIKRGKKLNVGPIGVHWPAVNIFAGEKNPDPILLDSDRSPLKILLISDGPCGEYRVLAEGDGRLYFLTSSPLRIACIPLDAQGRPIGTAVPIPGPSGRKVWDHIKRIPQPRWGESCSSVTSAL